MICTGSSNCVAESGRQVRMPLDHGVHRVAQPVGIKRAAECDVQLHRIHIVVACAVLAWKSSPCCSGVIGSTSAIS